ncbi:LysR family transcriptional regulator [Pseudomonas sp. TH39(2020)]|uniref:LysR substrate-binding domain-containing protein n=1 Tax=Pseudomonas sp. TH39(2020) TaxID=2796349 RepID=UPI0019147D98|nr:LysR family transcriptional regulator [Pseudomonas sp. TH39(2020)]
MRNGIPSLGALQAFEAAARHQSFAQAADELSLSSGAISRSIHELETLFGVTLFRRERQRVILTDPGARYAARVRIHLEHLRRDTVELVRQSREISLDIAIGVSFSAQWLIPKLSGFYRLYPYIRLHLMGRDQPYFFNNSNFDAALYFGRSLWPGMQGRCLLNDDDLLLVCAPGLMGGKGELSLDEIDQLPRISLRDIPDAWHDWCLTVGLAHTEETTVPDHRFEMYVMAINAALESLGVALLPRSLIWRELQQGRLIQAHPVTLPSPDFIYCAYPDHTALNKAFLLFEAWLLDTVAEYQQDAAQNRLRR